MRVETQDPTCSSDSPGVIAHDANVTDLFLDDARLSVNRTEISVCPDAHSGIACSRVGSGAIPVHPPHARAETIWSGVTERARGE